MNIDGIDRLMFIQKRPMSNTNKGAFWLSADKEIRKHYYGEAMMTWEEVKATL